ncbi:hypothetical protein [Taibaiella koreensis]|uniref:hypothetical protein n=1 Tax=Taibaiella koreensis TaxID=1268548 RepID=UPI0013C2BC7D|nr:hypothetical protein [Taibaiella koreensis]
MKILQPYEKHLLVLVKQDDSLCLYTPDSPGKESALFAAVQIMSAGVSFTVYNPGQQYNVFDCLPERIRSFYRGDNRFLLTRISPGLVAEISDLLLALFGMHSIGKYFHQYELRKTSPGLLANSF